MFSQGGAFVNNLVCGTVSLEPVVERPTPYHVPHSTQVAGYAAILGGDDRHIGNIFLGGDASRGLRADAHGAARRPATAPPATTATPRRSPTTSRWSTTRPAATTSASSSVKQPVYIRDNVYAAGAGPYEAEQDAARPRRRRDASPSSTRATRSTSRRELPEAFDEARVGLVTGSDLERVRFVDAEFEEPDGSPAGLDTDLVGVRKTGGQAYPAGPIAALASGSSRTRVW